MTVSIINNILVHLISDHKCIIPLRKLCNLLHLSHSKYFSARIRRITEDQRLCSVPKRLLQDRSVVMEIRRHKRNIDRVCPGEDRVCPIVFIERAENRNLVSRIAHRHHRYHHGLRSSTGHNDLLIRIDRTIPFLCIHVCQSIAEIFRSECDRILVRAMFRRHLQCLQDLLRRIKIRESLAQIDAARRHIVNSRHSPDDGVRKCLYSSA